jgi:hypothetical protein
MSKDIRNIKEFKREKFSYNHLKKIPKFLLTNFNVPFTPVSKITFRKQDPVWQNLLRSWQVTRRPIRRRKKCDINELGNK